MPTLVLEVAGQIVRVQKVIRPVTTIGSAAENDLAVEGAALEPTHAQISKEPDGIYVVGMMRDMTVNGRREKRKRLDDKDVVRIADLKITYYQKDEEAPQLRREAKTAPAGDPIAATREVVSAYKRLHEFSLKLLNDESTESLVKTLLDGIIELTGADKGFLLLLDDEGRPRVRAARNVEGSDLERTVGGEISDSILRKVIETKRPLIVADALRDEEFNASASVVSLKLLSVMCCPLMDRSEIRGVLYVGNNRVSNVFNDTALDVMTVFAAQASLLISQAKRIDELAAEKTALEGKIEEMRFGAIVGACDSMKDVFRRIRKVATTDISVLITGETGTGKELIAAEIHRASRRAKGPFVVINCGAIPENLLESELFGHVRGAFTGAVANKPGRFQAANGGTLFLDEIGEMPISLQVKILRALQEHIVTRVGDAKPEPVDIRVIAATNRVLEEEIKAGRFREDLYYRLNVVGIHLPPLRDRGDDLVALAKYFLAKAVEEHGSKVRGFSKSCLAAIRTYRWPGNVRQLENRLKKAVVLCEGSLLTAEDMDLRAEDIEEVLPLSEAKDRFQVRYINEVLERNGGNRTKTARDLGVDPRTIFRHLEKIQNPIPPEDGATGLDVGPEDASHAPVLGPASISAPDPPSE
jgi:transcriptional regulator with GAF, ATPase, and Fis domain